MGLYNVIFGTNSGSDAILQTLGLTRSDCGRFRDCFVANKKIAVYTRNGGGNRPNYADVFTALRKHPCYLYDEDDDFDCTYATIYFKFPEQYANVLAELDDGKEFDSDKRWLDFFAALNNTPTLTNKGGYNG